MIGRLILMRHALSAWNRKNLFTGWVDVPLSKEGVEEAMEAGKVLENVAIDVAYTSTLMRAQMTLALAFMSHHSGKTPVFQHEGKLKEWGRFHGDTSGVLPVYLAWELNERMYGDLQGLDKNKMKERYGEEQVQIWRRSFDTPPPGGESLEMTSQRTLPFFQNKIVPELAQGKSVFVCAHGNSIRSMLMEIETLSKEEVVSCEVPTGKPLFYRWEAGVWTKE